jgi:hypothetical protein
MKIGYYCESPADRAAMAVFTLGLLGEPPEPINMDLDAHSVPAFFSALDGVFRGIHYNSDAEGLVIVVDSNDSELHDSAHDKAGADPGTCRLCRIRKSIAKARNQLKPRTGRPELKVAIGLAVPAIEAWYLAGKEHQVGEAAWRAAPPFTKLQLKMKVYRTERPSLEVETECAVKEARRIIQTIKVIDDAFPAGFGPMANEIRSWKVQQRQP